MLLRRLSNRSELAKNNVERQNQTFRIIVPRNEMAERQYKNRSTLLENRGVPAERPRPKAQAPDGAFWGCVLAGTFHPLTRGVVGGRPSQYLGIVSQFREPAYGGVGALRPFDKLRVDFAQEEF
jgi:hypothetical protein